MIDLENLQPKFKQRVFGRRIGRPLNQSRQSALEEMLPRFSIPQKDLEEKSNLDPAVFFPKPYAEYWMEIGFGNGEHLSALMAAHPDKAFLGAEPFINGMAAFLKDIAGRKLENVRILMDDAMKIINSLEDKSLSRLYILNPDPWPKKRHHKRRIVNEGNLNAFSRVLKQGSHLIMATDVDDLADWMKQQTLNHPDFEWDALNKSDWAIKPDNWMLTTRYAEKGIKAGRQEKYIIFKKI